MTVVRRPTSIKIFGHKISIIVSKSLRYLGQADVANSTILILKGLSSSQERATALHEAMHHIWSLGGLNQALVGLGKDPRIDAVEEAVVRAFENGVFSLLRDNPRFVKWLLQIPKT